MSDQVTTLFEAITGHPPYAYQRALAVRDRPPDAIEVPTGSGKTLAVLVPWLLDPTAPRRLVYALPMRSLVEQTAQVVGDALRHGGHDDIPVHVLMGGRPVEDWARRADDRAVLVGTIDILLSRALGRGYDESRFAWPVSFGLLNNDCRWVFDEVQLLGPARATSAQLAGLRDRLGTALPCETIWMSATLDREVLATFDHDAPQDVVGLSDADRTGPLAQRLEAHKRVTRVDATSLKGPHLARHIAGLTIERHRPGMRTIVVLNRVELAQEVDAAVRRQRPPAESVLLHSRFRPPDRQRHMDRALAHPGPEGTIVVATQVIEAGVDMTSTCLITEAAPFSSMVQRLGRCNRDGLADDAQVLWIDRGPLDERTAAPYDPGDVDRAREAFAALEGESASPARLAEFDVPERRDPTAVLRMRDLLDLFDTSADLSGADVDVAPFIRDEDERAISVLLRDLGDSTDEQIASQPRADRDELVTIPIASIAKRPRAWTFDHVDGAWLRAGPGRPRVVAPGQTVLLDAADGGYSAERGWTGKAADRPDVETSPSDQQGEAIGDDPHSVSGSWVTLTDHLVAAHREADGLARALALGEPVADALRRAAALHDIGKASEPFQQMLLATAADDDERARHAGVPQAKSPHRGGRHVRRHYRHELASALALRDAAPDILGQDPALVRYLVAAHHGRVRLSIRPAPDERPPVGARNGRFALGVVDGDLVPPVTTPLGPLGQTTLDLEEMELGDGPSGRPSWTTQTIAVRDRLGPFTLAYLEALVRIADWRSDG